jgi:L-ascorbate metabolism protein UlaG (beta-lactamase superfamily)
VADLGGLKVAHLAMRLWATKNPTPGGSWRFDDSQQFFLGSTQVHLGTPHKDPLPAGPIDVLLVAIPAWDTDKEGKDDYENKRGPLKALFGVLKPKVVIPIHYDDYFWEWRLGCRIGGFANLPRFLRLMKEWKKEGLLGKVVTLDYGEGHRVK